MEELGSNIPLPELRKDKAVSGGNLAGRRPNQFGVLTVQMEMFINYLFGPAKLDPVLAAQGAGYPNPGKKGPELMGRPAVVYEIERRLGIMAKEQRISPQEIQDLLIEEAKNHMPKDGSATARVASLKLLAQINGMLKDENNKTPQVIVNLNLGQNQDIPVTIDGNTVNVGK